MPHLLVGRIVRGEIMSDLDPIAQRRYIAKLQLLDLAEEDDPYAQQNSGKFVDDMSKWPVVEYANIFFYYLERPRVYTSRQLMQWKSLEAYDYFQIGYVREVMIWPLSNPCCILMALVNPMCAFGSQWSLRTAAPDFAALP